MFLTFLAFEINYFDKNFQMPNKLVILLKITIKQILNRSFFKNINKENTLTKST